MLQIFVSSAFLSYLLLVWLDTDAVFEYLNLFKLARGNILSSYKQIKHQGYASNLAGFLKEYYSDNFVVRLATCAVCCSFWLGAIVIASFNSFESISSPALILFFYLLFNKML